MTDGTERDDATRQGNEPRRDVVTPYGSLPANPARAEPRPDGPVRTSAFTARPAAAGTADGDGAADVVADGTRTTTSAPAAPSAGLPEARPAASAARPTTSGPHFDPVPAERRASSPLDAFEAESSRRRWPRTLAVVAGVVVVLGGAYVGASYALGDKVPRGATVAGVEIGGLSRDAAVARLHDQLANADGKPIAVVVGKKTAELDPAKAGLAFDADASVDGLTGVDLAHPVRLWQHVVGVGERPASTSVDEARLTAALADLDAATAVDPVDGAIVLVDGTAHPTTALDGVALDDAAARDVVARSWLSGQRPLTLPTRTVAPAISQAETDRAMREIAAPLTAAPVSVEVDGQVAVLQPAQLAAAATIGPKDGRLALTMDGKALAADVTAQVPTALTAASDASFTFKDDRPVIVPGKPGTQLDEAGLATSVAAAAVVTNRTIDAKLVPTDPAQSTAALEALGITEIVAEFDTPLTSDHVRDINIARGAKNITGVVVGPGETFSLGDSLGPIDAAHGFVPAGALVDGSHTDAMGGGLSQLATTTYNAAYFAGFQDVEHHPHSQWFSRYPEGREATVFIPTLDLKWKNTSPHAVLVQAWISGNSTHVRLWGTKYWTVQSTTSARSGVVPPTTVYDQSKGCEPSAAGNPGFTVTVTRRLLLDGVLKDTTSRTTRYKPQNKIVCGPKPATPDAR